MRPEKKYARKSNSSSPLSAWLTFKELAERYEAVGIKKFIEVFGSKPASEVTSEEILNVGKQLIRAGLKAITVNAKFNIIKNIYKNGIEEEIVDANPAEHVLRFRHRHSVFQREFLTEGEIVAFLDKCKTKKKYMAAVFLICGIPVKKFLALCWEDIDFSNHTVRINKQLKNYDSLDVIHLERAECDVIEEPKMAFEFLELQRQEQEQQQLPGQTHETQ